MVYVNKTILELEGRAKEEHIHYANLNFAASQANSEMKSREGEIVGLASKETEYAQIRLHSREGQKKDTNGLAGQASNEVRT